MAEARKTCTACDRSRPLDAFPKQAAAKDGRKSRCRECEAAGRRRKTSDRDRRARGDDRYADGFRDGAAEAQRRQPDPLPDAFLRDLVRLCHPDLHPESLRGLATRTTAKLNALREAG